MHKPDTSFHVKTNRITERFIFRHLQSFPQVFFIISRVENEYQCHFAIDIACSGVTIRFSRGMVPWIVSIHISLSTPGISCRILSMSNMAPWRKLSERIQWPRQVVVRCCLAVYCLSLASRSRDEPQESSYTKKFMRC